MSVCAWLFQSYIYGSEKAEIHTTVNCNRKKLSWVNIVKTK